MIPANLLQHFVRWENEIAQEVFLRQPIQGRWITWTWAQAGDESRRISKALRDMGLMPGDKVAILSKNCAHWFLADLGIMMGGLVSVPIYPTLSASHIREILVHSEAKAIFIGKLDDFPAQKDGIPSGCVAIGTRLYGNQGSIDWEVLVEKTQPMAEVFEWGDDEVCTIIYTSGTTGKSKGVMHTPGAFEKTCRMIIQELRMPMRPRIISYLPLSHIAERLAIENYGIRAGATISFAETVESFSRNLAEVQPDLFVAVPRIWTKFQQGVLAKIPPRKLRRLLSLPLIGSVLRKKIRKKLGLSRASICFSGAAPISAELQSWFAQFGVNIVQVYGMTEDCVYAHMNRPWDNRFGTVGKPLPGLQVKFSKEGEIRVKCPGLFKGYYKDPEQTKASFDEEGFLCTGDLGEYDKDGFLKITGRLKDQFKTDKGKYVAPAPIELLLQNHRFVEQACVLGTSLPQPIGIVVLNDIGKATAPEILSTELSKLLARVNNSIENFERLDKLVITKENWTIENGLLTPTMKLKRNYIEEKFQKRISSWMSNKNELVWD